MVSHAKASESDGMLSRNTNGFRKQTPAEGEKKGLNFKTPAEGKLTMPPRTLWLAMELETCRGMAQSLLK